MARTATSRAGTSRASSLAWWVEEQSRSSAGGSAWLTFKGPFHAQTPLWGEQGHGGSGSQRSLNDNHLWWLVPEDLLGKGGMMSCRWGSPCPSTARGKGTAQSLLPPGRVGAPEGISAPRHGSIALPGNIWSTGGGWNSQGSWLALLQSHQHDNCSLACSASDPTLNI